MEFNYYKNGFKLKLIKRQLVWRCSEDRRFRKIKIIKTMKKGYRWVFQKRNKAERGGNNMKDARRLPEK